MTRNAVELGDLLVGVEEKKSHFLAIWTRTAGLSISKSGGWRLSLRLGGWLKAQLSFRAMSVVPVFALGGGIAFRAKLTLIRETAFHAMDQVFVLFEVMRLVFRDCMWSGGKKHPPNGIKM